MRLIRPGDKGHPLCTDPERSAGGGQHVRNMAVCKFNDERLVGRSPTGASQSDLFRPTVGGVGRGICRGKTLKPSAAVMKLMAKKTSTNFSRFVSGNIEIDLAMTALAAKDLVSQTTQVVADTARVSSIKATYGITGLTVADGVGPFLFGVAHSDYTDAEIEGFIEAGNSWDLGDMVNREIRSRRVRIIGSIGTQGVSLGAMTAAEGRRLKTKLNWVLTEGDSLDFWVYNMGDQPVSTTVPQFVAFGDASIWYD